MSRAGRWLSPGSTPAAELAAGDTRIVLGREGSPAPPPPQGSKEERLRIAVAEVCGDCEPRVPYSRTRA